MASRSRELVELADLRELKAAMRCEARALRDALAEANPRLCAASAGKRLLRDVLPPGDLVVAGFWPMGSEIDCRPILEVLCARGYRCCLPVVVQPRSPLRFRHWEPGVPLERGAYGEKVPPRDAAPAHPDVLIVPGLAFDRDGHRIGYGAGFYDRTLATLRAEKPIIAAGLAYSGQLVERVPREAEDEPLDWIVTDCETITCGAGACGFDEPRPSAP